MFTAGQRATLAALEIAIYRPLVLAGVDDTALMRAIAKAASCADTGELVRRLGSPLPAGLQDAAVKKQLWPRIRALRRT